MSFFTSTILKGNFGGFERIRILKESGSTVIHIEVIQYPETENEQIISFTTNETMLKDFAEKILETFK